MGTVDMFEEIALEAAGMLVFFFLVMIALVIVCSWVLLPRRGKVERTSTRKLKNEDYSSSGDYTIFHALIEAMKEKEEKQ